jgi:hypothetical protein
MLPSVVAHLEREPNEGTARDTKARSPDDVEW